MYIGRIAELNDLEERFQPNSSIRVIDNMLVSEFACGKAMLCILDSVGELYLYNDKDMVYKLKLEHRVRTLTTINNNFYALSSNNEFLYEFLYTSFRYSFANYMKNTYTVHQDLRKGLEIIKLPYFADKLLFFTSSNFFN
jgi:hypothetical protein